MEMLRVGINRRLFLGLFDYECHFARYAPGSFYKKHVDAFRGRSNRVLSTVFYLNPQWGSADGGELLIYSGDGQVEASVKPTMGTLVVFLSETVPHEVLPAARLRHSIAGWFRVNASLGANIDPPS
jgi:SM-20-related protein